MFKRLLKIVLSDIYKCEVLCSQQEKGAKRPSLNIEVHCTLL